MILTAYPPNQSLVQFLPEMMTGNPGRSTPEKYQICYDLLHEMDTLYRQFQQDMEDAVTSAEQRKVMFSDLRSLHELIYPPALGTTIRGLTDTEKSVLRIAATIIPQEDALDASDLDSIRESISALRQLIEEGDISPTLRKVLLELIRLSEDAISRFVIHGAKGLKRAFKAMLGEASDLYSSERAKGKENERTFRKSKVWYVITSHIRKFDWLVGKAQRYQPYFEKGWQFFLGGPEQQPPI